MTGEEEVKPGELVVCHEQVVLDVGPEHLEHLETIVDPLVVTDLATLVWSPHGHAEAVDALLDLAQIVLIDSVNEPDSGLRRRRGRARSPSARTSSTWRGCAPRRGASGWRPPSTRRSGARSCGRISEVTVRHRPDSAIAGLLFFGWLCKRLDWKPGSMLAQNGTMHGSAESRRQEVKLHLEPDETMNAPGLAGHHDRDRVGPLDLARPRRRRARPRRRTDRKGREWEWTVMGASRGEAGILGEGIRQALLRDKSYGPALKAARMMLA